MHAVRTVDSPTRPLSSSINLSITAARQLLLHQQPTTYSDVMFRYASFTPRHVVLGVYLARSPVYLLRVFFELECKDLGVNFMVTG